MTYEGFSQPLIFFFASETNAYMKETMKGGAIDGEDYVNVDALIEDFVGARGQDSGEYSWYGIHDSDDDVVDGLISYLLNRDKQEIAMKLKSAWIKKRYGSFFQK